MPRRRRAMTPHQARHVRQQGHTDALRFANLIGVDNVYRDDPRAKTDLVDRNGDAHSVKSGKKKWQIFLYGRSRFESDIHFREMDGVGDLFIACIDAFPVSYDCYLMNKQLYKERLRSPMRALRIKLDDRDTLKAFIDKAMFNAGEVSYLTILHEDRFHVFHRVDVIDTLAANVSVVNSQARNRNQTSEQKVVFKVRTTLGEIEVRHDSPVHHREVKLWLHKVKTLDLLRHWVSPGEIWIPGQLSVYGRAIRSFAPNHRPMP